MQAVLVPILLAVLLAACTADEVARSAYNGAKDTCRLNPGQCTIHRGAPGDLGVEPVPGRTDYAR